MDIPNSQALSVEFKHGTVITRLAEGTHIDRTVMGKLLDAHKAHARILREPVKGLFIWPQQYDYPVEMLTREHHVPFVGNTRAFAVVLPNERERIMANEHMITFPCPFPYQVFATEEEALSWLLMH
jgi:hypothetical protein